MVLLITQHSAWHLVDAQSLFTERKECLGGQLPWPCTSPAPITNTRDKYLSTLKDHLSQWCSCLEPNCYLTETLTVPHKGFDGSALKYKAFTLVSKEEMGANNSHPQGLLTSSENESPGRQRQKEALKWPAWKSRTGMTELDNERSNEFICL